MNNKFDWQIKTFSQLTTDELYDFLKLRIDVFVVEQTCYYPDLDDLDRDSEARHIFAYNEGNMIAYCRVLAPEVVYNDESAIGRVIVDSSYRGKGLAYELMMQALAVTKEYWPNHPCHISAQQHLSDFYQRLGFEPISEMYLEDGIPHVGMRRLATSQTDQKE